MKDKRSQSLATSMADNWNTTLISALSAHSADAAAGERWGTVPVSINDGP